MQPSSSRTFRTGMFAMLSALIWQSVCFAETHPLRCDGFVGRSVEGVGRVSDNPHHPLICDYCPMVTADAIQGSSYAKRFDTNSACPDCCRPCEVIFNRECACDCDGVDFEQLGRDIGRRAALLKCCHALQGSIVVDDVRWCREGHMVYVYAHLTWITKKHQDVEGEVYLAFVDFPCYVRRLVDINYRDDHKSVRRNYEHLPELVSAVNEELASQDLLPSVTRCTRDPLKAGNIRLRALPEVVIKRQKLIHW